MNGFRQSTAPSKKDLVDKVKILEKQVANLSEYLNNVAEQVTQSFNGTAYQIQNLRASYSAMDFVNKSLRKMLANKKVFTESEWNEFSDTERKMFLDSIETESDLSRGLTVVDRESRAGDVVSVNIIGRDENGQVIDGFEQHFLEVIVGVDNDKFNRAHVMIEEHLLGVKSGDKKENIVLVLDEKYGPDLQGKTVVMAISILKVKELENDETKA